MSKARIGQLPLEKAKEPVKQIYEKIKKNSGGKLPNIFQHMGNSPAVLEGFFGLSDAVNKTSLNPKLREQIALAVAQANQCQYCLSAHTAIAGTQGIPEQQILLARKGESQDKKTAAILHFAKIVVQKRGNVSDQDVTTLKNAGVSDTELVEIIMTININMFTNYFNHIVNTTVDFPAAPQLQESSVV